MQKLSENTKSFITFEEVLFENSEDLVEAPPWRGQTYYIAKFGEFTFEYLADQKTEDVLQALLQKYQNEYPGGYRLLSQENVFHIIPDSSRNLAGEIVQRRSLLDTPVTLELTNVTGRDLVCEVIKQVAEKTGEQIFCVTDFVRLKTHEFDEYGVNGSVARDVLVDVIEKSGNDASWFLWRDINAKHYIMTFIGQSHG